MQSETLPINTKVVSAIAISCCTKNSSKKASNRWLIDHLHDSAGTDRIGVNLHRRSNDHQQRHGIFLWSSKHFRKRKNDLYYDPAMAKFQPFARNSDTLDGLNAGFVIMDELHGVKDRNLYEVMRQSMSARRL